jgi:hypothetical protein
MRVSISISKDDYTKFKEMEKSGGFSNFSQMLRSCVYMALDNRNTSFIERQLIPLKDMLKSIIEGNDRTQEWIELTDMRLQIREGTSSVVFSAAKEIIKILLGEDSDLHSIIDKMASYDREIIKKAIVLLQDIDVIGSYRKKDSKSESTGEI